MSLMNEVLRVNHNEDRKMNKLPSMHRLRVKGHQKNFFLYSVELIHIKNVTRLIDFWPGLPWKGWSWLDIPG
ncbi:hypothetical protein EXN66_Car007016 [Channa argus]|uniref:Uncharacterized protein n=1 Tax=Channa argus TaxID=215402 RepID=A0A6G1PLY6_CHAAH|nr:hypothetical protein EXN66_Car007016 [Channa argus]